MEYTEGYFAKIRAARRRCRQKIGTFTAAVQTYRVAGRLECGHFFSFTLSARAYGGPWQRRRIECHECAEAEVKAAAG